MQTQILSLLVDNHFGVLTKVTGLFGRRGYNIKSLSVGETEMNEISRITIVTEGDPAQLEQIYKQVRKLEEVLSVTMLPHERAYERELLLVKTTARVLPLLPEGCTAEITSCGGYSIIEASGTAEATESLIETLRESGIIEMSRTGITAIPK